MIVAVTTKNSNIASVHSGDIVNISRLHMVISTIAKEYHWLFSKPKFKKRENKIEWTTELKGDIISYPQADEEIKEDIKAILKSAVFSILNSKNEEQKELLRGALEVPSLDNILYIQGKVVLSEWGHIQNSYNAKRGIVFDLIGGDVVKVILKISRDGEIADGVDVELIWAGERELKAKSDRDGEIELFLPKDTELIVKISDEFEESIKLESDINTLEINLAPTTQKQEPTPPPPPPQPKEPFRVRVWDCENDSPVIGDGEILVKADSKSQRFQIKEGFVEIDSFFNQEVLIDSSVRGYITKSETTLKVVSGGEGSICLYPMVELEKEGGVGDPRFNISWRPSAEDIDIMVVTPCGELIYYGDKVKECEGFRGVLDIDIREVECQKRSEDCQENITFDNGGARGEYLIVVKKYSGTSEPTDIVLTVINNSQKEVKEFTLVDVDDEKRFTIIH